MAASSATFCKGCWQQMHVPIPIRGLLAVPFRLLGIRKSQMNPNLCTICETQFTKVKKKKQIVVPSTVMFADLRGYTQMSQNRDRADVSEMLNDFYDDCASAVWERDGIINKFMGDGVLAVFNFPIMQKDHVRQAVLAGVEIQRRFAERTAGASPNSADAPVGVGVGIHTGDASIGEVGTAYKDFTIIGPVVNMASRIQGAAGLGEILVSEPVYEQVRELFPGSESRTHALKGINQPVNAFVLHS
jgi:adenylate cyclase